MTRDGPNRPARLRRLSDEEIDLWLSVAAKVVRRPGSMVPERSTKPTAAAPLAAVASSVTPPLAPPRPSPLPPLAPLERKLRQSLARGRATADAAIDLHGLRQNEAHGALRRFLHEAQRDGARVVLVVTGKGGRHADPFDLAGGGIGVLRRMVPLWLGQPEFRALVVGYEEASRPHGGAGALYVRLRRPR